jgi:class 3 adenylate cyclase
MPNLPSGTVTFLFSDIEGSTALLKQLGDGGYAELLATHRRLVRETFAAYDGQEIDTQGDAFFYSFTRARAAVAAAVDVQRAHAQSKWPADVGVRLRIGLHTGEPAVGDEGYTGLDVVRASRLAAIGRGGQVLLSDTTRAIVANDLPDGVGLRAMGERTLRDIERPEPLTELVIPGVEVSRAPDDRPSRDAEPEPRRGRPSPPPMPPGVPDWVSSAIGQWMPGGDGARDLIEQRVLSAIEDAFAEKSSRRSRRRARPSGEGGNTGDRSGPSMSDEIDRLRALHDAGALTEEQFRRAVDRVVGIEAADGRSR